MDVVEAGDLLQPRERGDVCLSEIIANTFESLPSVVLMSISRKLELIDGVGHQMDKPINTGVDQTHPKQSAEPKQEFHAEPRAPSSSSCLEDYLDYYCKLKAPGFAVLVTGEWGTGKTYQVRKALPGEEAYYISLYGLNSPDEVVAAIYAAMFPRKAAAKKYINLLGGTSASVAGIGSIPIGSLTSGLVNAVLRIETKNDKPLILDDLERCTLRDEQKLGIINQYVEHGGCRVIVIAHDIMIEKSFKTAKEKVFGHTVKVEPQIDASFSSFLAKVTNAKQNLFVEKFRKDIIAIFEESAAKTLRVLRHVIEDVARLAGHLEENHLHNDKAMSELVRLFTALNIEWRMGRIEIDDFRERWRREMGEMIAAAADKTARQPTKLSAANDRYTGINLTSTLLDDGVLEQMLVNGRFEGTAIRKSLNESSYFLKQQSTPWRIVSGFDSLDDEIVESGLVEMNRQFEYREVTDSGEMLHIFALRLMLANQNVVDKSIDAIASECKAYIDDLLNGGELPPRGLNWRWVDEFERGSQHHAYWIEEEYRTHFKDIFEHLVAARIRALEFQYPKIVEKILRAMDESEHEFFQKICRTSDGESEYSLIPVLAAIEPAYFVSRWMRAPKQNWLNISRALKGRYESGRLKNGLQPELNWIEEVIRLLNQEAELATGLARRRIKRIIPELPKIR